MSDFSPGNAQLLFESLGTSGENLAITAMDVQERSGGYEWFVGIRNFGDKSQQAILEFYAGANSWTHAPSLWKRGVPLGKPCVPANCLNP